MMEPTRIERPDWWQPGMPLPPLTPVTEHTGQGKINRMKEQGAARSAIIPCRWETIDEWNTRHG